MQYLFPRIKQWVAWQLWNGCLVKIGKEPFIGGSQYHRLSQDLIHQLNRQWKLFMCQGKLYLLYGDKIPVKVKL